MKTKLFFTTVKYAPSLLKCFRTSNVTPKRSFFSAVQARQALHFTWQAFARSEICSFTGKIFSYLKFRPGTVILPYRAGIAFHVACFCLLPFALSYSQVPLGFNYQAVVRDAQGNVITDQVVSLQISILEGSESGSPVYVETHQETTNSFGLITLEVGSGTMIDGDFLTIDWSAGSYFMKIELDVDGGTNYQHMGTSQLLSVPYALNAASVTSLKSLSIMEQTGHVAGSALFEVKNKDGNTVFAVYNEGVRIYVNDDDVKGLKGGFAVGGFSSSKGITNEYLRVTPDSVRIYIDETIAKGLKGGFAVGGFSPGKAGYDNLMHLTPDNYFIGHQSGSSITSGLYNSFFGYQSGLLNNIGNRNVFLGYLTGFSNTIGNSNNFIGNTSGYSNIDGESNVFLGDSSGYGNSSGSYNVIMGTNAGKSNTTGSSNVFIGDNVAYTNSTGYANVFIGKSSGYSNTEGYWNIFVGRKSGNSNTTGYANISLGDWSGVSNTTGYDNVFIGDYAGGYNTEGFENVFLGANSGLMNDTGDYNVFLGSTSGYSNVGGNSNVFIGQGSGYTNTIGNWNIFMGDLTGYSNTQGNKNVFIGSESGHENTTGNFNTFLGNLSGYYNVDGISNVIMGHKAGYNSTTGSFNVCLGTLSGTDNTTGFQNTFVGQQAGYQNTTGNYNTVVGSLAGNSNLTGNSNVFIGYNAGYSETGSDKLYIENSDAGSASALIYGDFNTNILQFNANVGINGTPDAFYSLQVNYDADDIWALVVFGDTWCSSGIWEGSDLKLKKNIQNYSNALSKVNKLRGVSFEWRYEDFSSKGFREGVQIGMIAQEVEEVLPELVKEGPDGLKSINYSSISAVLVEAIKEQQKMIEELQERIAALEEKNE